MFFFFFVDIVLQSHHRGTALDWVHAGFKREEKNGLWARVKASRAGEDAASE